MNPASRPASGECCGPNAGERAAPGHDEQLRGTGRELGRAPCHSVDGLVGQVGDVLGGPVVAVAGRVVNRALEVGVAGGAEEVCVRAQRPDGRQRPFAVCDAARPHAEDRDGRAPP